MVAERDRELPRIIARAQAGDAGAFTELYTRYAGHILRYLYARLREQESAQDLTQEVFVRVIKGITNFEYRGEKSFLGWLYTIASNVLIGQMRQKRLISTPLDDGLEVVDPHGQEAVLLLFDQITLRQAINQLTADQQHVLTLKFFADLSNAEVALAIGRTEGAVKALQHRALHALHEILEREASEPLHTRAQNGELAQRAEQLVGSDLTANRNRATGEAETKRANDGAKKRRRGRGSYTDS